MKIFTRYLNSAAYFDANNDQGNNQQEQKTPAQLARESIQVTKVDTENDPWAKKEEEGEKKEEDIKEDDKEAEENDEDEENDDNDEDEEENETDEQKQARLAKQKQERKELRMQKRIDRLTATLEMTNKEKENLKKQLEANPDQTLTAEEVQRQAEELAAKIIDQRNEKEAKEKFDKDCDTVQTAAIKADKDFMKNINEAAAEVGPIPQSMIYILVNELDHNNAGDVMAYLAKNVDEYEDVYGLNQIKMTKVLVRLSDKLHAEKEEAKKNKKERSNVPPPVKPVNEGRNTQSSNVLPNNPTKSAEDMEKFVRLRNEQAAAYRKQRGGF